MSQDKKTVRGKQFGDKLYELRKKKRISQREIAHVLNVSPSTVTRWEKGEVIPRDDKLNSLAKLLEVPPEYLKYGIEKNVNDVKRQWLVPIVPELNDITDYSKYEVVRNSVRSIKLIAAEDLPIEQIPVYLQPEYEDRVLAIRIYDDDMMPVIYKDDIVIFDFEAPVKDGDLVVVIVDGRQRCRFIQSIEKTGNTESILPYKETYSIETLNPRFSKDRYRTVEVKSGIFKDFQIVGKVIEIRRQIDW